MTHARDQNLKLPSDRTFDTIYHELRERISLLAYPPGTMLSENILASEFGVSRTPIRRVLQRLEFDGLVTSKHGVGTIVTSLDFMYLKQVYVLRLKLLDIIADLSAVHVSDGDLIILGELLEHAKTMYGARQHTELSRLYTQFNEELIRAIGNRPLREITDRLFYQTHRVWLQLLPEMNWVEEVDNVVDEFSEVLKGLRARDMKRVSEVRRDHFIRCLTRINVHLSGLELGTLAGVDKEKY
jgi:DNA-binding GntR family transcriptional regulator